MTTPIRIRLLLPLALAMLAGCQDRELPTAPEPEIAFAPASSSVGCGENRVADLIAAIDAANADPDPDVIGLAPGCTYTLTEEHSDFFNGLPPITNPLSLEGNGARIERDPASDQLLLRILIIDQTTVSLSDLTIAGGRVLAFDAGLASGAGIYNNRGTLTLTHTILSGNTATLGAGIYNNRGTVTLLNSTVSGGQAFTTGGIHNDHGALTLLNSTVSGNRAYATGGIENGGGTLRLLNSTVSDNHAQFLAGGITSTTLSDFSTTSTTILNSTISGNTALSLDGLGQAGGVLNRGGLTRIVNSTITANSGSRTGGVITVNLYENPDVIRTDVKGSLIWGNTGPDGTTADDVAWYHLPPLTGPVPFNSLGHNLIGAAGENVEYAEEFTEPGDQTGVGPGGWLGPLALNAPGTTKTHALLWGSPAIDAGVCTDHEGASVLTDQRGVSRPQGAAAKCDIGAFELEWFDDTPPVITPIVSGRLGDNGWYVSDVTVSWSVVDEESEVSAESGCDDTVITSDTGGITLTCEASSAGGEASESVTVKRDATAPTLAPSVAPDPVLIGGSAVASPKASDDLSGVASESCDAVDASSVGSKSLTCMATDNAGNTTEQLVSYTVVFAFDGFFDPVSNPDVINLAKAGQTIPLKWRLLDVDGVPVADLAAATTTVENLSCGLEPTGNEVAEDASGASGLQNLGGGYYQYNWKTPKSYANSCKTLKLDLGEGVVHTADFKFTR